MPTVQQVDWIRRHTGLCRPAFADIGSRVPQKKDGGSGKNEYASLRPLFPGPVAWVGIDMTKGAEVDLLCDLTEPLSRTLVGMFRTVFCLSVLEHVSAPWLAAGNLEQMLEPGGVLFVSVPWCWRYHAHPSDYWRMSPAALQVLFEPMEWIKEASCLFYGVNQKPLKEFDIRLTRPYAHREKHLMHPVTVNMAFRKR